MVEGDRRTAEAHLGWRRRLSPFTALAALCVGLNLLETGLVLGFDHGARPDLAPQASAVAPFGVFGDLRWLSVYHDSWLSLGLEVAAMLAVRATLIGVSVGLAWPSGLDRPSPPRLLRQGLVGTAIAAVLLAPSVALLFGMAAVPVSWLFLAAVPAAFLVALLVHPVAVTGDWWRRPVALRAVGWVALSFLVLTAATAVMGATPLAVWPVVAGLSGLFNAWTWSGLVRAVLDRSSPRLVPVVPAAILAFVALVAGGTVAGFSQAPPPVAGVGPLTPAEYTGPPVLVVSGYGSTWDGGATHPIPGNFVEERFSYRGLDAGGRPRPYGSRDTVKTLVQLDRMLLSQIASLRRSTGRDVAVVAESEGALVAKTALLADPSALVADLVMASPLRQPGRVSYPTGGASGWGVGTAEAMRLLSDAFQGVAPIDLSPENPFLASLDQQAPLLAHAMACPLPHTRQFALLPLADATVVASAQKLPFPSVVLPAFHGGLLGSASGTKVVAAVLSHRPVTDDALLRLADTALSAAAGAWQVPTLAPGDYPGHTGSVSCAQVASTLAAALAPPAALAPATP